MDISSVVSTKQVEEITTNSGMQVRMNLPLDINHKHTERENKLKEYSPNVEIWLGWLVFISYDNVT